MSDDFCMIHGPVLVYDSRSGFEVCPECEEERKAEESELLADPGDTQKEGERVDKKTS